MMYFDGTSFPRASDPQMDRDLEALLLKALARDPDRRYSSAGELAADLGNYLKGEPLQARTPTLRYFVAKRLSRHRASAVLVLAVLLALAGIALLSYVQIS